MNGFLWPVRVYYEDTDSGGVVYYANYLKFMERARTEWLRNIGFEQDELISNEGVLFAVRSVKAEYIQPARFNDELLVSATVIEQSKVSISFAQQIIQKSDHTVLCEATIKIVSLNAASFKPCRIPATLLKKLNNGE